MKRTILPGSTVGVLGGGQLGRMFALAAKRLGYRVHVFSPVTDCPAGQVADRTVQSPYDDLDAVARFAERVDVLTYEFENLPIQMIEVAERFAPVYPGANVLLTTQNRLNEKTFLASVGIPVTPFVSLTFPSDLAAVENAIFPSVLKTATSGYDGKGQEIVNSQPQVRAAWEKLGGDRAILEKFVDFAAELSVIAVRGRAGEVATYPPIGNTHRDHILDLSVAPIELPPGIADQAVDISVEILNALDVVGVICVEFFLTSTGELLVNEIAPRPHNSAHLTIDAFSSSQFDQQVRAVCGLPLAKTTQLTPAAMVNLLGDFWQDGSPDIVSALEFPEVNLHLYGKAKAVVGRKMGHLTALAPTTQAAIATALAARQRLYARSAKAASIATGDSPIGVELSRCAAAGFPGEL